MACASSACGSSSRCPSASPSCCCGWASPSGAISTTCALADRTSPAAGCSTRGKRMYQLYGVPGTSTELGWEVGLPLLGIVLLLCLAVPVWVALGFGAIGLLVMTDVLPLTLFAEALFSGIDAFDIGRASGRERVCQYV